MPIIPVNDIACIGDSTVLKVIKIAESCKEAAAPAKSDCGWLTTAIVCATIVVVALIAALTIYSLMKKPKASDTKGGDTTNQNSQMPKQTADLVSKLLDFQRELAFPYEKGKDGVPQKKEFNEEESKNYRRMLYHLIKQMNGSPLKEDKEIGTMLGVVKK